MKARKIIYWIVTGLLCAMMLLSAGMYFAKYTEMSANFVKLGYPYYLPKVLGGLKILGVIALIAGRPRMLKEWAYAGFAFVFILAIIAHIKSGIPSPAAPAVALLLLLVSRRLWPYASAARAREAA